MGGDTNSTASNSWYYRWASHSRHLQTEWVVRDQSDLRKSQTGSLLVADDGFAIVRRDDDGVAAVVVPHSPA
jgi:hypothetical protein